MLLFILLYTHKGHKMNLQTLAFIANIDSLFTYHREPFNDLEKQLLLEFDSVKSLLQETYSEDFITAAWERSDDSFEATIERKKMMKTMDILFHRMFKRLHDSFKCVREYYIEIIPDIEAIFVNSSASVISLIELYSDRSEMLRRDKRHKLIRVEPLPV